MRVSALPLVLLLMATAACDSSSPSPAPSASSPARLRDDVRSFTQPGLLFARVGLLGCSARFAVALPRLVPQSVRRGGG